MAASASDQPAGRFITFEGGEGGGKSTQAIRLAAALRAVRRTVVATREPGGTPFAEKVRTVLLSGAVRDMGVEVEAMLFAAARIDHVDRVIRPALARGEVVVCDRFIDSSRVYQGEGGCDRLLLAALERVAVGDTRPDLTLILDLPAAEGLTRAARRAGGSRADRFEGEALAVHEARRAAFRALAETEPRRCVLVDASGPPDVVTRRVRAAVARRLPDLGLFIGGAT